MDCVTLGCPDAYQIYQNLGNLVAHLTTSRGAEYLRTGRRWQMATLFEGGGRKDIANRCPSAYDPLCGSRSFTDTHLR